MKEPLFIALLLCSASLVAQDKFPEPDFSNTPVWYDSSSKTLKNFERLPLNKASRATGMYSAESLIIFAGTSSTTKFVAGKVPPILVKMNTPTEDPSAIIDLGKLTVNEKKGQREFVMGKAGIGSTKTTVVVIMIDFKKLGNGVYQIIPAQDLPPGEYVFSSEEKRAFLFSITDVNGSSKSSNSPNDGERHGPRDPLGKAIYNGIHKDDKPK